MSIGYLVETRDAWWEIISLIHKDIHTTAVLYKYSIHVLLFMYKFNRENVYIKF